MPSPGNNEFICGKFHETTPVSISSHPTLGEDYVKPCLFSSQEAQKCFCGTDKCRGFIGISKNTPQKTVTKKKEKKKTEIFSDIFVCLCISNTCSGELF